jgi:hypothetical protein
MIKTTSTKVTTFSRALALVAALVVIAVSAPASASFTDDTVGIVEYMHPGSNWNYNLLIQLSGSGSINYTAYTNPPACSGTGCVSCPAPTIDTIKTWVSLSQSALLAGKRVRMYYTACKIGTTDVPYAITGMDLNK